MEKEWLIYAEIKVIIEAMDRKFIIREKLELLVTLKKQVNKLELVLSLEE